MALGDLLLALGKLYIGARTVGSALSDLRGVPVAAVDARPDGKMRLVRHNVVTLGDRMKHIRRLTRKGVDDPKMRLLVGRILGRKCGHNADGSTKWCTPEKDASAEIRTIFAYVRNNVRYTGDIHNVDTFQTAARTLEIGVGDCDDAAVLLATLFAAAGYPVKFRVIQARGEPDWSHIFVLVGLPPDNPREWIALDATVRQPAGWHPPESLIVRMRDFDFDAAASA